MPRRLLHEPHLLAHELRTPLSVLAGWFSLIRDGDITPQQDRKRWDTAMTACQVAVDRLNLVIAEACDEASVLRLSPSRVDPAQFQQLLEATKAAIDQSQEVLERIEHGRGSTPAEPPAARTAAPRRV